MARKCPQCDSENTDTARFCSNCAAALSDVDEMAPTMTVEKPTEELKRGSVFAGRYEIIEELGKGGMGRVYRVEDIKTKEEIALKMIKPEIAADKKTIERFRNELTTARKIAHRNVCRMYDLGEEKGQNYITMEYVPGGDLKGLIRRTKQLAVGTAISISKQICEGLAEAHSLGIVHRDLKPSNIMIDDNGNARIMDFGIARSLKEKGITGQGVIIGTPEYMSPEQVDAKEVAPCSDLYSLGVVLYEMVTGKVPFEGDTPIAIGVKHRIEMPKDPREYTPQIPEFLCRVILKCLEKEKTNRYQTAKELLSDLHEAENEVTTKERTPVKETKEKESTFKIKKKEAIAVFPFTYRGSDEFAYLREGIVDLLSTSLDGAGELRAVDPYALLGYMEREGITHINPDAARSISKHFQTGTFILGSIVEMGGRLNISAFFYDKSSGNEAIVKEKIIGKSSQIFELVDELSKKLLMGSFTVHHEQRGLIAELTTRSYPALKAYLFGESELRAGRPEKAVEAFQQAIDADDSFALAYYRLGLSAGWLNNIELMYDALDKAIPHKDRLSGHHRRLLEAFFVWWKGTGEEAEQRYRAIVGTYPDDVEAWYWLAETLIHYSPYRGGSVTESRMAFERVLQLDPESIVSFPNTFSLFHLAEVALREKKLEEIDSLTSRFLEITPEGDYSVWMRVARIYSQGGEDLNVRIENELLQARDLAVWGAIIFVLGICLNDFACSRNLIHLLTDSKRPADLRACGYQFAAFLKIACGQMSEFEQEFDAAASIDSINTLEYRALAAVSPFVTLNEGRLISLRKEVHEFEAEKILDRTSSHPFLCTYNGMHSFIRKYLLGLLCVRLKEFDEALKCADGIREEEVPQDYKQLAQNFALSVQAHVAASQGKTLDALRLLEQTKTEIKYPMMIIPFFSLAQERFLRAELLKALNRHEEALDWFRSTPELSWSDIIFLAPSHFRRAEIYEDMGLKKEASDHYEKFLSLWKDADPGLPEVDDAKERLDRLKSN